MTPPDDLEKMYETLALAIDRVGPQDEALFLAKLALVLARLLGDPVRVAEAVALAEADL